MPCLGVRGGLDVAEIRRSRFKGRSGAIGSDDSPERHSGGRTLPARSFRPLPDLDAEFPALARPAVGWWDVALMCVNELERARLVKALHSHLVALEHR